MLVADDHRFFSVFAQSPIAENILLSQVETLIKDTHPCEGWCDKCVKFAGEIMPGL